MHKWWARRPGCLFRAITLYSLLDENTTLDDVEVYEPGENKTLGSNGLSKEDLINAIGDVSMDDPESLWDFYPKDIRIKNKKILDPFMGGGTSLVEASRFGVDSVGVDLNPVAWFVTKKELDAGQTDVAELEAAFEEVKEDVADDILQYYQTPCPNGDHDADVMYNFWVMELDCVSCGHTVPLFKDYRVAKGRFENDDKYNVLCPDCGTVTLVEDWQEESECNECGNEWNPKEGNVTRGGYYNCPDCGQKESIIDGIADQGKPDTRLYAVEYYCEDCDQQGRRKSEHKGYKKAGAADKAIFEEAKREWETRTDLHEYVPDEAIPEGAITAASSISGNDVFRYGYERWEEMFNERQLLSFSKLLKRISTLQSQAAQEYLLLAFTDALRTNTMMVSYDTAYNKIGDFFRTNTFDPATYPVENNVWGTKFGRGTFTSSWDMVKRGVEYANAPTDRYVNNGESVETDEFAQPIGLNSEVYQDDMRNITAEDEFDAVITDPPYYDNIIYSEVADYFYVWQKILLEEEYPGFDLDKTPRAESIVTNPYLDKTAEDFEHEMGQALEVINRALKDDGTLAFTYHHSDEESWGELLESLCNNDFEVTATYPINSDLMKFIGGEAVSFDIVIVARPTEERTPISWRRLRIEILNRLEEIQESLEEHRDLSEGDIGVVEMGACFSEYSKHHGEVRRSGDIMTAKEAVQEIYGIIQDNALGEQDIFLALQRNRSPSYNDFNKLLRRSEASEEEMREKALFRMEGNDFIIGDWRDQKRQAYVQDKVTGENGDLTVLDKAHFLRYRYEEDKSTKEYLERWNTDDLQELCEGLAEATGDETYLNMLGVHNTNWDEFTDE
ncbi:Adenine-specific DNA methylase, contains a Zn-ribbon domain [Halorientalis persicus]|uniref:Adenine-specific DNA methylase, contains a Zn-ribbon domain n=2 Tax=Halorientalis persicus TaxID=1367881 RepID=A0A1H8UTV6_9EURY|nr:Adenine-specific DNA methylase, contains a Zn-ribbon domain [Halorientalis persicus]